MSQHGSKSIKLVTQSSWTSRIKLRFALLLTSRIKDVLKEMKGVIFRIMTLREVPASIEYGDMGEQEEIKTGLYRTSNSNHQENPITNPFQPIIAGAATTHRHRSSETPISNPLTSLQSNSNYRITRRAWELGRFFLDGF